MFKPETFNFCTGSTYSGEYNKNWKMMNGFGVYISPTGYEYRGYFKNGLFHGYGRLVMPYPNKFIYTGFFEMGVLTKIDEMVFSDGLKFRGNFNGIELDTKKWSYLNMNDRLLAAEQRKGLPNVGTNAMATVYQKAADLPNNTYDVGEGIFMPSTNFIVKRKPPFKEDRFVGCLKEVEWIKRNCRKGLSSEENEQIPLNPIVIEHIIESNLKSSNITSSNANPCFCNAITDKKRSGYNFCLDDLMPWLVTASSDSCVSFTSASKVVSLDCIYQLKIFTSNQVNINTSKMQKIKKQGKIVLMTRNQC